jgi:hypothetical protein
MRPLVCMVHMNPSDTSVLGAFCRLVGPLRLGPSMAGVTGWSFWPSEFQTRGLKLRLLHFHQPGAVRQSLSVVLGPLRGPWASPAALGLSAALEPPRVRAFTGLLITWAGRVPLSTAI